MTTEIPAPGLGTWQLEGDQSTETVRNAIEYDYRHIDTAQIYENEEQVGQAIQAADVPRDDLFVATKIWNKNLSPEKVRKTTEISLDKLGLDRVDLLYVHWPAGAYVADETLPAVQELQRDGLTEHVGLSNFTPELLEEAIDILGEPPLAHQVEMHPLLQQRELHKLARKHDMYQVAYSPLKRTELLGNDVIQEIARETGGSPAQVCLAWHLSKEKVVPIPKATGIDHLRKNFSARNLHLSENQIKRIDELDAGDREIDPPFAPW